MKSTAKLGLAALGCALLFNLEPAKAATITFDVSAVMVPADGFASSCAITCTLAGTIVIDNSLGLPISVNISMFGGAPAIGPFTIVGGGTAPGNGTASWQFFQAVNSSNSLVLNFASVTTGNLVGSTGGPLGTLSVATTNDPISNAVWRLSSGAVTPVAVPGPVVGAGLPAIVIGGVLLGWWRRKRIPTTAA